ncbi:metal-dependent phosphoesterase [Glutamicibacter uratoxydans]|uniref:Metal-dependent phosphoesterase n=1 Tax=Glutamicibacter uratoxydans TaxID=43667 RepID=A0A4Y4DZB9_GLUUR|nr:PHP domain-containing protein [Glutamicibacter uratoxydans]GED07701.1 metal-dependent phosphoesterase [Glutamicibacter uratoxydans]
MRIDLHTHSNVSDGTETPAQLIAAAAEAGLDVVALTDHDQTAGWDQARDAAAALGLGFVPGMEITCQDEHGISVHLLSYLQDPNYQPLLDELAISRNSRIVRAQRIVERLAEDYPITWDLVAEHCQPGATVGRPHIADALVSAGIVSHRNEAFANMLSSRSRYYVSHPAISPAMAVGLVREAGGVPVFAHPKASLRGRVVPDSTFYDMIDAGLGGVEVHHRDNTEQGKKELLALAKRFDLIITGSSDYHGTGKLNRLGENLTEPGMLERIVEQGTGTRALL